METKPSESTVHVCPSCGGECVYIRHEEPSRFAAIREIGVIQQLWQCRACRAEFVLNVQPADEPALA